MVKMISLQASIANDLGNSHKKMIINDQHLPNTPSVIKKIQVIPNEADTQLSTKVDLLYNDLTVDITSDGFMQYSTGVFMVGQNALSTGSFLSMDIDLGGSLYSGKHQDDVPLVVTLGNTAAWAIKKAFAQGDITENDLDVVINVDVDIMTTSIPASEWTPEKADILAKRFTKSGHSVKVYLGKTPILVNIKFAFVKVFQEGGLAMMGIANSKDDILKGMKSTYKVNPTDSAELKAFKEKVLKLTPKDLLEGKKLGLDIGAGTSDVPYIDGIYPDSKLSKGIAAGIGHAEQFAAEALSAALDGAVDYSRHQYDKILSDSKHNHHQKAKMFIKEGYEVQAVEIFNFFNRRQRAVNADFKFIPVFGGGSIDLYDHLHDRMLRLSLSLGAILVWIPAEYAVLVNVLGLNAYIKQFKKAADEKGIVVTESES